MNMKSGHEEQIEASDEPNMIPYRGHPDWKIWLDENHQKFSDGRIKAADPSFYSFLISRKLLQEAKDYLSEEYKIRFETTPKKKQVLSQLEIEMRREEFIDGINAVRRSQGRPELQVLEREPDNDGIDSLFGGEQD